MSLPDDEVIVSLEPPGGLPLIDWRDYAGKYVVWSGDHQRIIVQAETWPELLVLLQELDERGERYIIGGFVPENLRRPAP